jgi:hypothetical protein
LQETKNLKPKDQKFLGNYTYREMGGACLIRQLSGFESRHTKIQIGDDRNKEVPTNSSPLQKIYKKMYTLYIFELNIDKFIHLSAGEASDGYNHFNLRSSATF